MRRPAEVGAIVPSSRWLAQAMLQGCDLKHADTVVELGPGTGAFTGLILRRLGRQTTFFAVELMAENVRALRRQFPGLTVYRGSAESLPVYLGRQGKAFADCIVSGLPWSNMLAPLQDQILEAILGSLSPHGVFTTFAYLHAAWLPTARHFRKRLEASFARVSVSPVVWRNVPPAFVYRCRRPS